MFIKPLKPEEIKIACRYCLGNLLFDEKLSDRNTLFFSCPHYTIQLYIIKGGG